MVALRLIVMCLFGYAGYREASKFERDNGRRAYSVPAWGWAVITAFSLIIGALLLYFARRSAGKNPAPVAAPPAPSNAAAFGWSAPEAAPSGDFWAAPPQPGPHPHAQPSPLPTNASRDILPGL